jgi:subtilisin family serine protease
MTPSHRNSIAGTAALIALLGAVAAPGHAAIRRSDRPVAGRYIVVLQDASVQTADGRNPLAPTLSHAVADLTMAYGGRAERVFGTVLTGFALSATPTEAEALSNDPRVASISEDGWAEVAAVQTPSPSWGLDRIDQRPTALDTQYNYNANGAGIDLYVVDTGIRSTHQDFGGRVDTADAFTAISDGLGTEDCNGHGTHVAGVAGGTTYGVAKGVAIHPVRVLDCGGVGPVSNIIAGVDWISAHYTAGEPTHAVVNMSIRAGYSYELETAVSNSIALGVTYVAAAGNDNDDACWLSPGRVPEVINVAATDATGARWASSNFGTCVDLFAPGAAIVSAFAGNDTGSLTMTGTSAAAPHVAGTAVLVLASDPTLTPAEVAVAMLDAATADAVSDVGPGSLNLLLYSAFAGEGLEVAPPIFIDGFETGSTAFWN